MLACCEEKLRLATQLTVSSMREEREKNDDRDGDAKQPKKNASAHDVLLIVVEG
jgi:hypothetical protein